MAENNRNPDAVDQEELDQDGGNNNPLNDLDENGAPPLNPNVHFSLPDALRLIRKYNGRTDVKEWVARFETDLLAFNISTRYAVLSLDRFFTEDAANWWSSVSHKFKLKITDPDARFLTKWQSIVDELTQFFDHSSLLEMHKSENRKVVFKIGDDPQQYVTRKLAILKEIDENMNDRRKIDQLKKGLPENLQLHFATLEVDSISSFLNKLRNFSQVLSHNSKKEEAKEKSTPYRSLVSSGSQEHIRNMQRAPTPATQQKRPCFNCQSTDHLARECPEKRPRYQGQRNPTFPQNQTRPLMSIPFNRPPQRYPQHSFQQGHANRYNSFPFNPVYNPWQFSMMPQFSPFAPFPNYPPPQPAFHPLSAPPQNAPQNRQGNNLLQITEVNDPQNQTPKTPQGNA